MTTDNIAYGTYTALAVTGLNALASSATVGWQSTKVDNTSTLAIDYEVLINFAATTGTVASDKALYFYVVPWVNSGALVPAADFGTVTLPTGTDAAATISATTNSMKGPYVLPIAIVGQLPKGFFTISQMCGGVVPDAWSLMVINFAGIALAASGTTNVIGYRPITYTNA